MKNVKLFTDGCALGNPGKGGAGAILIYQGHEKELMKYLPETTNNRAELEAIIIGLEALNEPCNVMVLSDSQITVKCASGEFNRSSNLDLWQMYDSVSAQHTVQLEWIRKDTHPMNKRAHDLANKIAQS